MHLSALALPLIASAATFVNAQSLTYNDVLAAASSNSSGFVKHRFNGTRNATHHHGHSHLSHGHGHGGAQFNSTHNIGKLAAAAGASTRPASASLRSATGAGASTAAAAAASKANNSHAAKLKSQTTVAQTTTTTSEAATSSSAGEFVIAAAQHSSAKTTTAKKTHITTTTSAESSSTGLTALQASMVASHTNFRAQYDADPVSWNTTLATVAQDWANRCVFEHGGGATVGAGENLAEASGALADSQWPTAFQMWADEASDYDAADPQYSHFTQVVWKATKTIGCAMAECPNTVIGTWTGTATLTVCEYFPAGNVIGEFAANVA
ncbi:hypothetical protein MNV49_006467 [Pseudohyphozyma bogoriensis]|nr:hypothetical protein MNV49_006467 [Pseudohyphozyma bogoriensis]